MRADAELSENKLVSPIIHAKFDENYSEDGAEFILLEHSGTSRLKEETNFVPKTGYHRLIPGKDFSVDEYMKFEICINDAC